MKHVSILSLVFFLAASNALADVNVLIIGSTHDTSEFSTSASSTPFSPTPSSIATYLQNILDAADPGTVNVSTRERYATGTSSLGDTTYAFNLASWFHWPYPTGSESNRWADLRGEGTNWNYVVLIPDPYTIEYTPGLYAHGVAQIANEVAKGSGETVLLMSWPSGSHSSVDHYKEMTYRAGRSGGYKVAPAGLAWDAVGNPTGDDAAYLVAATIYSRIYGQNAKDTGYNYNSTLADCAYTTTTNNVGKPQYSGNITFQNPYLFNKSTERQIYRSSRGTSTENYFNGAANTAIQRCNVAVAGSTPWNTSTDAWAANGGDEPWTTWVNYPTPIAWNHGRDGATAEWFKSYIVNSNYWDFAYGYRYHGNAWWETLEDANAHYIGQMLSHDNELAHRMLSEGDSARNMPVRHLWAQFHKEYPSEHPQSDGSGPHLSVYESEAVGTFMVSLYSGRCPLDPETELVDRNWVARKIGYETAWQLGRCQTRAPGFKVMPVSWNYTNLSPTVSQTLSVQFILQPRSNVAVSVRTDDNTLGWANPSVMTFTPENYDEPQTVTVMGETGSAGSFDFNIILTTSSGDEVYDGLFDSWNFVNNRPEGPVPCDIRVKGNGSIIVAGDTTPEASDWTFFGYADGSITRTFSITNQSSSNTVVLTGAPNLVTVTGPGGHFSVSQDAATSNLIAGSETTFQVAYDPQSIGTHTATVEIASSDATTPVYAFEVSGVNPSPPTIVVAGANADGNTRATLSCELTAGEYANAWICWGNEDAGTGSTGAWDNVVSLGGITSGAPVSTSVTGLSLNVTYWFRCYASSTGGTDWSDSTMPFSGTPAAGGVAVPVTNGLVAHWDATKIQGVADGAPVAQWLNSANPGSYDMSVGGGSPTYRAAVTNLGGRPAVEFVAGGTDWFGFSEIDTIRAVFWVLHDSYATSGTQMLLGHNTAREFYTYGDEFWAGNGVASEAVKCGILEVDGVSVEGHLTTRPTEPAVVSLVTTDDVKANRISKDRDSDGTSWEGMIAEVLIYDVALSSEDRAAVGNYLASKYQLSTTYPGSGSDSDTIVNSGVDDVTASSAVLKGVLDAHDGDYAVYAFWGASDGGTNPASWASNRYVGSWSSTIADINYTVGGLNQGQDYFYTLCASNQSGVSWAEPSWGFATYGAPSTNPVAAPFGLIATTASLTRVDLDWIDISSNETGFLVERSLTSGSGFSTVGEVAAGTTVYADLTAQAGMVYYYRITATNATASSDPSDEAIAVMPAIPATITLGNLTQPHDGNPKPVSVVTDPVGLSVDVTYDWSSTPPSAVGSYTVRATVTEPTYQGSTNATLVIVPSPPSVQSDSVVVLKSTAVTLHGTFVAGGAATISICWGETEAGATNTAAWDNTTVVGTLTSNSQFSADLTGLTQNATYWFRCYATNSAGVAWSSAALSFSGTPAGGALVLPVTYGIVTRWDASDIKGLANGAQVEVWTNSANPGTSDLIRGGGSPTYVASATEFGGMPAVQFTDGGNDWFSFTEFYGIRTVFWVLYDSHATSGEQFLLGDNNDYSFHGGSNGEIWHPDYAHGRVKNGITELDGVSVDGTVTTRPTEPAIISLRTNNDRGASQLSKDRNIDGRSWEGKMAEVIIYDEPLSLEERNEVGSYLANKYQLATSYPDPVGSDVIMNTGVEALTATSAVLNGYIDTDGGNYDVYLQWGEIDGGTNAASWTSQVFLGSLSGTATNVTYSLDNLSIGQAYHYTLSASNQTVVSMAAPSWSFTTLSSVMTTPTVDSWPTAAVITYGQAVSNAALTGGDASVLGGFAYDSPATVPNAGVYAADVIFIPDDTNSYYTVAGSVNVTVNKADPSVTNWPTASEIQDGQAVSNSVLSGGGATVSGNFTFDSPSATPAQGTNSIGVTFTPDDASNYNTVGGNVDLVVTKVKLLATIAISDTNRFYTGSPISVTVTTDPSGLTVDVTYGGSSSPPTDAGSYSVIALIDDADYAGSTNGMLTISKATPSATWPTASSILVGQAVSNSTLSGGSSTPVGSFSFDDPAHEPSEGTYAAAITFTPDDTTNWSVLGSSVDIDVLPLPPSAPTGLTAVPSLGQVDLSWASSTGATNYSLKRSTISGSNYVAVGSTADTNYTDSVANGARYYYVVTAENAGGASSNSSEVSATLHYTLPFSENFESLAEGDLNGQNLWLATNAVVQTNMAEGVNAGSITSDVAYAEQEFWGAESNVWTDLKLRPVLFSEFQSAPADTTVTVAFYFLTNGHPVVFDGTNALEITDVSVTTGEWVRCSFESDYVSKTWDFYIDTTAVATNLGFYNAAVGSYKSFKVKGGSTDGGVFDDFSVGLTSPLGALFISAPSGLTGAASDGWNVGLGWIDNSTNETAVVIERSLTSGSNFTEIAVLAADSTNYSDSACNPGQTYYYRVFATNTLAISGYSSEVSVSTPLEYRELTVVSERGTPLPVGVTTSLWDSVVNASMSPQTIENGTTQYVCTGWVGTGSATNGTGTNTSFNITNDTTITWQWQTNYYITFGVQGE